MAKTVLKKVSAKHIKLCKGYGVDPNNVPEVHSFEAACKITGDDPKKLPIVKHIAKRHQKYIIAAYILPIIAEALKLNKTVDYTNTSQWKVFARFLVEADKDRPSGFGLSYRGYDCWHSLTGVGVRLCFPDNWDAAIFFGKHFIDLHKDYHLYT